MSEFTLHPQLEKDTIAIGRFPLSLLLLHKDANYPWFILVPQRPGLTEIHQLDEADRARLITESCHLAKALEKAFQPDKLNLATIGNMVPQLHYHHVARYKNDPAWPGPVWGAAPPAEYEKAQCSRRIAMVQEALTALSAGGFSAAAVG